MKHDECHVASSTNGVNCAEPLLLAVLKHRTLKLRNDLVILFKLRRAITACGIETRRWFREEGPNNLQLRRAITACGIETTEALANVDDEVFVDCAEPLLLAVLKRRLIADGSAPTLFRYCAEPLLLAVLKLVLPTKDSRPNSRPPIAQSHYCLRY